MQQPARMSDVAKLAQVSSMTISRVLNGSQYVREETRQRVHAAVEQLGYRRNEIARSLRERRSRQIGILVPNLYDPFFALCAHVVSSVAKAHGYSLSIATTDEDPETEFSEACRMFSSHVEGIVVIPAEVKKGRSRLASPELGQMPIVTLDRPLSGGNLRADTFLVQNKLGAQLGTEHLLALGHKRVIFIGLEPRIYTIRKRCEGYEAAMRAAGYPSQTVFVCGQPEEIDRELREMLCAKHPPDALFCANNLLTREVLHGLQRLNLQPPKGVALVGFDDFEIADLLRPGITVVRQPTEALTRQATEVLFARLGQTATPSKGKRITLPVELVVRGSCGSGGGGVQRKPVRNAQPEIALLVHSVPAIAGQDLAVLAHEQ